MGARSTGKKEGGNNTELSAGHPIEFYNSQFRHWPNYSNPGTADIFSRSNDYFYIPFNDSTDSFTAYGNMAADITRNAGGDVDTDHPYTITDNTYNSGAAKCYGNDSQSDNFYLNANDHIGGLGYEDFHMDMWYNWMGEGNGGGSYGYVWDGCGALLYCNSRNGDSADDYIKFVGAIGSNIVTMGWAVDGTETSTQANWTGNGNLDHWYHVLILRRNNRWFSFLDGTLKGVSTVNPNLDNLGGLAFGGIDRSGHWWNCRLADFMFSRGTDGCFYGITESVDASNIGDSYFTTAKYKNKLMAIPTNGNFFIRRAPDGFTIT